ncbi:nucleotidyltransferase substrate binding protein [Algoriphagus antarcticus]|uniref:Nucleotidyltransferase substrate binding protein (TIGR01987 family) n=1 Tax=Algoriphagus antarcticus TaxID=238540 RepID=A0A3E0D8U3_9BACT|nr:nucleotidyltransferase substrate binding protein [Algoriphagus antarcticus]REG78432.1 nucleotidyltransferase substrate binding protein (TIGR01987 family) [Algoriphagus antarcticus]
MENDIRWKQRLENFSKAVKLLGEVESLDLEKTSQLEKEGIIQRFEFTLELGWKTLKDRMESDGLVLHQIFPKMVAKEAFKPKYIDEIENWIDKINDRNLLNHTYNFSVMEEVIPDIQKRYSPALSALHQTLM